MTFYEKIRGQMIPVARCEPGGYCEVDGVLLSFEEMEERYYTIQEEEYV